jgi:hypothetical protein
VEQFARHDDATTAGLHSAGWTADRAHWWSSASFSRSVRTQPSMAARIVPTRREGAEAVYRRHGGGTLPEEALLRNNFHDYTAFPATAALTFAPASVPAGFAERRLYRVLFAKQLTQAGPENLRALWRAALLEPSGPDERVLATARRRTGDDVYTWDLRSIGPRLACCLDVTALLRAATSTTVGPVLGELTEAVRQQGLIPVTTERFC